MSSSPSPSFGEGFVLRSRFRIPSPLLRAASSTTEADHAPATCSAAPSSSSPLSSPSLSGNYEAAGSSPSPLQSFLFSKAQQLYEPSDDVLQPDQRDQRARKPMHAHAHGAKPHGASAATAAVPCKHTGAAAAALSAAPSPLLAPHTDAGTGALETPTGGGLPRSPSLPLAPASTRHNPLFEQEAGSPSLRPRGSPLGRTPTPMLAKTQALLKASSSFNFSRGTAAAHANSARHTPTLPAAFAPHQGPVPGQTPSPGSPAARAAAALHAACAARLLQTRHGGGATAPGDAAGEPAAFSVARAAAAEPDNGQLPHSPTTLSAMHARLLDHMLGELRQLERETDERSQLHALVPEMRPLIASARACLLEHMAMHGVARTATAAGKQQYAGGADCAAQATAMLSGRRQPPGVAQAPDPSTPRAASLRQAGEQDIMQLISSHCKALESLLGQDPAWAAGRRPLQQQQQQQQQHAVPQAVVAASSPTALSFSPLSARRLSDEVQGQRFRSPTCSDDGRLTQAYDMLRASACELLPPKELPSSRTSLELWGHAASQQQQQQQARPSHPRPPPPPRPPAHFPQHQLPSHAHVMASAPASGLLGLGPLPADDCDPPLLSHQTKVPQQTPANLLCSSNPPDATTSVQPPTAHLPQPPPTTARAPVGSLAWAVAAALKGATPTLESPGPVADMASSAPSHAGRLSSAAPAPASSASGPASSLVLMLLSLLNERDGHQAAVSTHDSSAAPAAAMPAPPAAYATVVKSAGGTSAAVTPAALHVLSAAAAAGSGGISGAIVATADGSAVGHGLSIAMLPVEPPRQLASSTSLPPPALLPPSPPPASRLHRGAYASPERQQLRLTDRSASFPASPPPPSQFLQRQQQRQQHLGSSPSPTLAPLPSPRVVTASAQRRELRGSGSHTTGAPPTPRGAVQAVPGPWPPASPKPSPKPSPRPSPKPSPFASPAPLPKASPFASPLPSLKGGAVRQPLKGQAALRTQPKGGAPQSRRPVLVAPASAPPRPGGRPRRMSPGSQDLTGFEELQQSSSSEIEDFLLDGVPLSPICDLRAKYSAAAAQQPTERQLGHSPSPKPLAMPPLDRLWSTQAQAAFAAEPSPDPAQPLVGYSAAVSGEMGAVSGGSDVPGSGKGNPAGMRDLLDVIEAWTKVAYVEVERLAKQRSAGGVGAAASLGGAASPEAGDLGREASGEGQGQGAGARLRESKSLEAGMGQGGAAMQQESAGSAGSGALGAKTASGATSADMPRLPEAVPSAAFARLVTQPAASAAQPATQLRMQAAASAGGPSTGTAARPLQVVSGAAGTGQLARHAQQQRPAPAVLPELLPASGQQHVAAVRRQWAEREAAARGPALAHAVHGTADAVEQQHVVMTGSGDQKGAAEKRGTVDSEEGGGWWGSVGGAVQQESAGKAARQQPPVAVSAVAVLAAAHSQGQGGAESLPSSAAPTLAGGPTEAPSSAATGIAAAAAPPSTTAPACASPAPAVSPSASAGSTGPSVGSTVACEISVRGSGELLHQPQPDARQAEADTAGKQRDQGQGPAAARDDSTAASADEPASGVQQGAAAEQQRRAGKGLPKHEDDSVFAFHQPPLPATAAPGVSDTGSSPTSSVSSAKLRPRAPRAPPSSPSEAPWHRLPPSSPASPASASKPKGPASSSTEQWRQRLGLALSHVNPRHASGVEGLGPRQRKLQGAEDRASRVVDDKTQRDAGEGWQRRGANEEGGKAGQVREGEKQGPLSLVGKATGCGDMGLQKGEASETSAGSRAESRSTRDSSCATQREGDKATAAAQAPEAAPASEGTVSAAAQAAVEQPQGRTDGHAGVPLLSGAAGGSMAHGVKLGVMEACTAWVPQEKEQREGEQETGGTGCSAAGDVPRRVAGVAGSGASVDVGGRAPDSVCAGAVSKEPSKGRLLRLLGWPFGRGRKSAVGGRDAAGVGGDEERPKGKGGLLGCARA